MPPKIAPSIVSAVLQRISNASQTANDVSTVRALITKELELAQAVSDPREAVGRQVQRGRSFFDELELQILTMVRAARSREDLLKLVIEKLAQGRTDERAAICYIVFEGRAAEGHVDVEPILQAGLQTDRFEAFAYNAAPLLRTSPILTALFRDTRTLDFEYTEYLRGVDYDGEFDLLINDRKRGVWIAGVPLPGIDASMPDRALVGLYPSAGPADSPSLPRGARPEWRLMEFLQTGYALLNHQLEGRAEIVASDRRNLIADLAPQAINHELYTQLGALENQLGHILTAGQRLEDMLTSQSVELGQIAEALDGSFNAVHRAKRITEAFINLERRTSATSVRVGDLIEELLTIVDYRRKKFGVRVDATGEALGLNLRTDTALVEHVLLNVVMNAIDALAARENVEVPPRISIVATQQGDRIRVLVSNNGPPIDRTQGEVIFEKGITSKERGQGHGQGLYICRLVMNYMFGSIELLETPQPDMNVTFAIEVPIVARHSEDLMGQRAKSRR